MCAKTLGGGEGITKFINSYEGDISCSKIAYRVRISYILLSLGENPPLLPLPPTTLDNDRYLVCMIVS